MSQFGTWVSVKDDLPIDGEDVLVYTSDGLVSTDYFDGYTDGWGWIRDAEITHWMPMPDAPNA